MEENIAHALKLAAFTLMFVLALAIGISSFSIASTTLSTIIDYSDRENEYIYIDSVSSKRVVSLETIIPTIMRAYVENYKIYFYNSNGSEMEVWMQINDNGTNTSKNYIDLETQVIGSDEQINYYIIGILYGSNGLRSIENETGKDIITIFSNLKIAFTTDGIYGTIKESEFEEYLGEYYQDDLGIDTNTSLVPETNKTKKRIITYKGI